jgi:hypothetical protein
MTFDDDGSTGNMKRTTFNEKLWMSVHETKDVGAKPSPGKLVPGG